MILKSFFFRIELFLNLTSGNKKHPFIILNLKKTNLTIGCLICNLQSCNCQQIYRFPDKCLIDKLFANYIDRLMLFFLPTKDICATVYTDFVFQKDKRIIQRYPRQLLNLNLKLLKFRILSKKIEFSEVIFLIETCLNSKHVLRLSQI